MGEKKDYYLILGVSRTETIEGIRTAFRDLAKKYHPDRAGQETTRFFQEITEAYCILSDSEKRKSYNEHLQQLEEKEKSQPLPVKIRQRTQTRAATHTAESFGKRTRTSGDPFEEIMDRFFGNFWQNEIPRWERPGNLSAEVILSRDEARRGGILPIDVPVFQTCPFCRGTGYLRLFPCAHCREQGIVETRRTVSLRIPPGTTDATTVEIPVGGAFPFSVFVRLRVGLRA